VEFDPERPAVGMVFGFKRRKQCFIFVYARVPLMAGGKQIERKNRFVFFLYPKQRPFPLVLHHPPAVAYSNQSCEKSK